mgnify:CR=1 FL=1
MKRINFEIEGIVPILFNRFTEAAQLALEKGSSGGGKKTKEKSMVEAEGKVYRSQDGKFIGIPALNLKKTILNGCQMAKIKYGKGTAVPYLRAIMFIETDFLSFGVNGPDDIHECTGNIPPGPKGHKVIIRRPFLNAGWKLSGVILIVDDRIDPSLVKASLEEGGLLVGLCDHRPEYGRFKVNKFEGVSK